MHGKQGGGPRDTSLDSLHRKLLEAGMEVVKPEMPWSFNRFIDGNWDTVMNEIRLHVDKVKQTGANKVVLIGHSLGSPAAMSYAARHADVSAIALLAPGHIPYYFSLYKDFLIREGRQYVFDKLPKNPKSKYLEVSANHITTPSVASDEIVQWLKSAVQP